MVSRNTSLFRFSHPLSALLLAVAVPLAASASFSCGGKPPAAPTVSSADEPVPQEDPPLSLGPSGASSSKTKPAGSGPVSAKGTIKLVPEGMRWGMSRVEVETMVDKFIEDDYKTKLAAARSPQVQEDLHAEIVNKAKSFRRSYIDLTSAPTGLDSQPIASEYSKNNGEGIQAYERGIGVRIYFLYINNKLWKTYEEVKLVEGGLYGKDFLSAAEMLIKDNGNPKFIPADPDHGRYYGVNEWTDNTTHMRVFELGGNLAVAREDKVTLANIANLRKNSAPVSSGAGAGVDTFLRGSDPTPKPLPTSVDPPKKK